jgi:hypothetical protein
MSRIVPLTCVLIIALMAVPFWAVSPAQASSLPLKFNYSPSHPSMPSIASSSTSNTQPPSLVTVNATKVNQLPNPPVSGSNVASLPHPTSNAPTQKGAQASVMGTPRLDKAGHPSPATWTGNHWWLIDYWNAQSYYGSFIAVANSMVGAGLGGDDQILILPLNVAFGTSSSFTWFQFDIDFGGGNQGWSGNVWWAIWYIPNCHDLNQYYPYEIGLSYIVGHSYHYLGSIVSGKFRFQIWDDSAGTNWYYDFTVPSTSPYNDSSCFSPAAAVEGYTMQSTTSTATPYYPFDVGYGMSTYSYGYYGSGLPTGMGITQWNWGGSPTTWRFAMGGQPYVYQYWPISGATPGGSATLWAHVWNSGSQALASNAYVWFYVDGPGWGTASHWFGAVSISGLAAHSGGWYYYVWSIPVGATPGTYTYWAKAFYYEVGGWMDASDWYYPGQTFTVSYGLVVTSYWPVYAPIAGGSATLWAQVKNQASSAVPAGTWLWFYVSGPGYANFVTDVDISYLGSGASQWYSISWVPPSTGTYTYWAKAYYWTGSGWVDASDWRYPGQAFTVTYGVQITSYWPPSNTVTGGTTTLWAQVKNLWAYALPSAVVWFYVDGPGWTGSHWVGYKVITGQAAGTSQWYGLSWTVPFTLGTYTYWAIAYTWAGIGMSDFHYPGQTFNVTYWAQILSYWPPGTVSKCTYAYLWAQVKNLGTSALPSGAVVWFYVDGPAWSGTHWVGYAYISYLNPGSTQWYSFAWYVPYGASYGTYTYWAIAYTTGAISDYHYPGQTFTVSGSSCIS